MVDRRSSKGRALKRLISMTVGLALGMSLWTGSAWAEGELMDGTTITPTEQSLDVQHNAENAVTSVFSEVQATLNQVGLFSPLRSLLNTIAAQVATLELQLAQLYDDLFVETCPTCDPTSGVAPARG